MRRLGPLLRLFALLLTANNAVAADPLRITVLAANGAEVGRALEASGLIRTTAPSNAEALLVLGGPGTSDAAEARRRIDAGTPVVIVAADPGAWPDAGEWLVKLLGATRGAVFAGGAPLRVINLFAHPIFTATEKLETDESVPAWTRLADDAQLIAEGITGEETTPLAWVRTTGARRVCHLVPASAPLLADPSYQRNLAQALLWTARRPIPGAKPAVQRTFMPESYPGAFAITFPEGVGVCLDPVRGGVNFAWEGDFVDLRPRWLTKQGAPARILGSVFYVEKAWQPLRAGSPGSGEGPRFRGYTLRDGVPEFHHEVGGRSVHETLRALPNGEGFVREFQVGAGNTPLWLTLEEQTGASVTVAGASCDGATVGFTSTSAGRFSVTIRRNPAASAP
jgi:hypothetical protein